MNRKNITNPKLLSFIFFFFIVPVIGAYFLFWNNVAVTVTQAVDEGKIIVTVNTNELLKPNPKNTIRKIFQVPFNLTFYNLCFDNYSRVTERGEVEYVDSNVTFEELNGDALGKVFMKGDQSTCFNFNSQSFIVSSAGGVPYQFKYFPTELKIDTDIRPHDKAEPVRSDKVASSVIFTLALWGIIFLLLKMWELLKSIVFTRVMASVVVGSFLLAVFMLVTILK